MLSAIFCVFFVLFGAAHCVLMYLMIVQLQNLSSNSLQKIMDGRQAPKQSASYETDVPYIAQKNSFRVQELPPDAIAPHLKNPPRPAGGFGSSVRSSDGH